MKPTSIEKVKKAPINLHHIQYFLKDSSTDGFSFVNFYIKSNIYVFIFKLTNILMSLRRIYYKICKYLGQRFMQAICEVRPRNVSGLSTEYKTKLLKFSNQSLRNYNKKQRNPASLPIYTENVHQTSSHCMHKFCYTQLIISYYSLIFNIA